MINTKLKRSEQFELRLEATRTSRLCTCPFCWVASQNPHISNNCFIEWYPTLIIWTLGRGSVGACERATTVAFENLAVHKTPRISPHVHFFHEADRLDVAHVTCTYYCLF
jgi:hypothetical protein